MNKAGALMIFTLGAGVGIVIGCRMCKDKYEQMTQEDVEEIRRYYEDKQKNAASEYVSTILDEGYSTSVGTAKKKPYVIPPEKFGEHEEKYTTASLTYYADGVLTDDEYDEPVDNIEELVGDFASHFGEYEDDSVFVRNDITKCDYEILRDLRRYSEVAKSKPHGHREDT